MEGGILDRGRYVGISEGGQVMKARCGLEDCDCEYTIGGLLRRLELISEQANLTVKQTRAEPCPCGHIQSYDCDTSCLCYQAGHEAERRPPGA